MKAQRLNLLLIGCDFVCKSLERGQKRPHRGNLKSVDYDSHSFTHLVPRLLSICTHDLDHAVLQSTINLRIKFLGWAAFFRSADPLDGALSLVSTQHCRKRTYIPSRGALARKRANAHGDEDRKWGAAINGNDTCRAVTSTMSDRPEAAAREMMIRYRHRLLFSRNVNYLVLAHSCQRFTQSEESDIQS